MGTASERRIATRRNVYIPLLCWELVNEKPSGPNIQIFIKDMSESGVAFKSQAIYQIGTVLQAEIYMPGRGRPIVTRLKVARVEALVGEEKFLIGAAFTEMGADDRNYIASSLEGLNLYKILAASKEINASDIHLTVGRPPICRIQGRIQFLGGTPIVEGQIKAMVFPLLNAAQVTFFENNKELDFAFSPTVDTRYRVNLHIQKGFLEAAIRAIPASTRNFKKLNLPYDQLERLCREKSGLILISGKTGSGKTTTLTSMIDYINNNLEKVIITIEDPVEYVHTSNKSILKQREIGSDTASYAEALKHTLRQDPDIIIVSELLDSESILSAIRAAETGHLVIATIHAPDSAQTMERILNLFPPEHSANICNQIASCLIGILFQMLLPDTKGNLTLATELLISTSAIRANIRDGKFSQLGSYIQTGSNVGMYTLESSLQKLYDAGVIDSKTFQAYKAK
jgi:twitching motility protein PilT